MTSSEKSFNKSREVTSDKIFNDSTFIEQYKKGYRFNSDSMILSWFISKVIKEKRESLAIEIGSGTGVIPIVLSCHGYNPKTYCVEKQSSLFELLKRNIIKNRLVNSLTPVEGSFFNIQLDLLGKCDLIYTNPPYFPVDKGRISPDKEKSEAKHEFSGSVCDFLNHSKKYLINLGQFVFVYPVSRIQYALTCASKSGFSLKDIYFYRENSFVPPNLFTANLIYGGNNCVSQSELITMRNNDGDYTSVGKEIMYDKN